MTLTVKHSLIIGLPGQAFVQETFIGTGGGSFTGANSASGGQTSCMCFWGNPQGMAGSGWDPLRNNAQAFTDIATGDPTQTLIRQVINTPGMSQEFLKDKFALKPKITQDINTSEIAMHFVVNMSNSNYSASTTAAIITNTLAFTDPSLAASGNFNSATPGATPGARVTAGRYTYVPGSGGGFGSPATAATYAYVEGANSFNPNTVDWQAFRDVSQNLGLLQAGNSGKGISGGGGGGFGGVAALVEVADSKIHLLLPLRPLDAKALSPIFSTLYVLATKSNGKPGLK